MRTYKKARQKAGQSAVILLLSTVFVKIIGAAFKIPLASNLLLGDLGFGYFSVAYDLFTPFYVLAISGLPSALSNIIAEFLAQKRFKDIEKTFLLTKKLFFIFGIVLSLAFSIFAIPFVKLTDTSGNTLYSVFAVIPSVFLCFIISSYRGFYEGFTDMNPTAISKIIEALGKLLLGLGFAFLVIKLTANPAYAAGGAMLGISVGTLVSTIYLKFKYKFGEKLIGTDELSQSPQAITDNKTIKLILALALPMALSSLISSAVSLIDALSVRSILQINANDLIIINKDAIEYFNSISQAAINESNLPTYLYGIRSKAFTLFNLVPTLTMSLGVGALPTLSYYWSKNDILLVKKNFNTIIKMISLIALPAGMAFIAVSSPIMKLLYSDYGSVNIGGRLLFTYGFAAIFAGFSIPLTSILQSFNCQFKALVNILIGAVIKIILNIILVAIPSINIYGAAISTAICYLYILLAHIYQIVKILGKTGDISNILIKPLIASVISSTFAYVICLIFGSKIGIICGVAIAIIAYVVVLILLKTLNQEDFENLPKGKKLYFGQKN